MSRVEAAAYLRVSPGTLDKLVAHGEIPGPVKFVIGRKLFDRHAIDRVIDGLSGIRSANDDESGDGIRGEAEWLGAIDDSH